jgi:hypothetical protein
MTIVHQELDPKEEQEREKELAEKFKPLLEWLKGEAKDVVRDGKFMLGRSVSDWNTTGITHSGYFQQACLVTMCGSCRRQWVYR